MTKKQKLSFGVIHIFGIAFCIFCISIGFKMYHNHQLTLLSPREIALGCTTDMATEFHIHPFLKITINGEKFTIPDNIGITDGCMNAIHTHEQEDGKLHVEAPVQKDFTLGDFFAVWKKPFNKNQIFDYIVDEKHTIAFKVNGKENTEFENLVLKDDDVIEIIYETKK